MAFKEQGIFEDHLESYHKIMTNQPDFEAIVESLKEKGPQVFVDRSCPLCCNTAGDTPMKFAQHVGKHMEAIALAALPQGSDSDSDSDQHQGDYETDFDTSTASRVPITGLPDENFSPLQPLQALISLPKEQETAAEITKNRSPPDKYTHSEIDEDDNDKREADGIKVDFALSDRVIIPTLDGFMAEIHNINPRIQLYLCYRLGYEQLRRYKKLLTFKVEHAKAIQRESCSSGTLCGLKVEGKPPRTVGVTGGKDSENDISFPTTSYFPDGALMPPTKYFPSEFECPYCFQVKRFKKASDWSKHA